MRLAVRPLDGLDRSAIPLRIGGGVLMAQAAVLIFCGLTVLRFGGAWPMAALAGAFAVAALGTILDRQRRASAATHPSGRAAWPMLQRLLGLAWSVIGAATCGFCMLADHGGSLSLAAAMLACGVAAAGARHSADAPNLALTQIALWLLPVLAVAPLTRPDGWIVSLMATLSLVGQSAILFAGRQNAQQLRDTEAECAKVEATLALRDAELRGIFDNAAAGVTEVDLVADRFVRVNRVFCEMLGRSEAELLGRPLPSSGFTHPEDQAEQAAQWAALRKTGHPFDCERRYVRPDGSILWGRSSISVAVWGPDGRPLRAITILQDMTRHKQAEAALLANQNLLRLSLDIGGVGTFRRDYVAGLISCSHETRVMTGLPLGDAPIQADTWWQTVLPDDRSRFLKDAAEAHAERRSIVCFDYRFMHPERGIRYAETRSRVDYDADGKAVTSIGVVIDVTDRRRTESRLAHLAHHDPLTDLPNRSLFRIRLDQAMTQARHGQTCAVLYLDLDHFKDVNDTLGHSMGDALLCAVTRRLQAICRVTDTVARLGGDEFAVIQTPLRQRGDAECFAERISTALAAPYDIEDDRVVIGTSIGISLAPDDGTDAERLLRNADMALYGAKAEGRGRYRFFDAAMEQSIQARRTLDGDLRQALAEGAFELFYQPLVMLASGRIRGFEALLRWRHPVRGLVTPDAFIPLAESNGLIVPIGALVLGRACAEAATWPEGLSVAVNLSASEFTSPGLVDTVEGALRRSGLAPPRLELEITETTMLQHTEVTLATLQRLKRLGVRISIDDFGTGFSSLGYLQRFPFDKVKIDRSFVAPLGHKRESLAIVGAIVNLCAGLDMASTAEGVETKAQLAILAGMGCTEAQGYYFSRPRPAGEVVALIDRLNGAFEGRSGA